MIIWYVVIVGQQVGVFPDWLEASPLVSNVAGSQYKSYETEGDAKAAYQRALDSGYVRAIGSATEPPQSITSATVPPTRLSSRYEPQTPTKKWYVVIVGRDVGVFTDWLQVAPLVYNVAGSQHNSYDTESEAKAAYRRALDNKHVRVVDPVNRNLECPASAPETPTASLKSSRATRQTPGFEADARHPGLHPKVTVRAPNRERGMSSKRPAEDGVRAEGKEFISDNVLVSKSPNRSHHSHAKLPAAGSEKGQPISTTRPWPENRTVSPVNSKANGPEQKPTRRIIFPRTSSLTCSSTRALRSPASSVVTFSGASRVSTPKRSSAESHPSAVRSPTISGRVNVIVADLSDVESYPSDSEPDSDESSGPEDVTPKRLLSPINSPNLSNTQDLMLALSINRMSMHSSGRPESASGTFMMQCTPRKRVRSACGPRRKQVKDVGVATSPLSSCTCANRGHEVEDTKDAPSKDGKVKEGTSVLGLIGMLQPTHVPSVVYKPESDPRSPIRDVRTLMPHVSFGRPSPKLVVDASTPSSALFSQ